MEVLILDAICLYSVSACIWVAWKGLSRRIVSLKRTNGAPAGGLYVIITVQILYSPNPLCWTV